MEYKLSASILNANFLSLKKDIDSVIKYIDEIHLDIMDGHFVENLSYGFPILEALKNQNYKKPLDTHLMISNPQKYWKSFCKQGSDILTFHYETTSHSYIILKKILEFGCQAGISLTPATPIEVINPIKNYIDRILIMTVEPGFGGQSLIPEMLEKIEKARRIVGDGVDIEVDGGVKPKLINDLKKAGANVFVVGSYIFKAGNKKENCNKLIKLIKN